MPAVPASRMPISAFVLISGTSGATTLDHPGGTKPSSSMQVAVTFAIPAVWRAIWVDLVAVAAHRVVDEEWHGVERVAGLRDGLAGLLSRCTLPFLSRWYISSALP